MVFFVTARLQAILFALVAVVAAADAVWAQAGHFDIDAPAYGLLALITRGAGGRRYLL